MIVQPRALAHRGVVDAAGFFFDTDLIGVAEARRRVLALWTPGLQVYRIDLINSLQNEPVIRVDGLLARLPGLKRINCSEAPGTPLTAYGALLSAAPLAPDELQALQAEAASGTVLVRAGIAIMLRSADAVLEDPAFWFELGDWIGVETVTLGASAQAAQPRNEQAPFDARKKLGNVPPASPENIAAAAALRAAMNGEKKQPDPAKATTGEPSAVNRLRGWLLQKATAYAEGGKGNKGAGTGQKDSEGSGAGVRPKHGIGPIEPYKTPDWERRARMLAARLAMLLRLDQMIGRRQSEYVRKMMEMMDHGDPREALRYAIPLNSSEETPRPPMLNIPTPRGELRIMPQEVSSPTSIHFAQDLFNELRALYRKTFQRLEAEGKIEEAAFVLAELLHANEEAVSFLERHGKLKLAAEMAEARNLPPGLIVRQWFLAGDKERAIAVARRRNAFSDALLRLEQTKHPESGALRLLWAQTLAEAGDYPRAVEVAWPLVESRSLALEWIERSITMGGTTAARMLARKLALAPESFPEVRERVLALLEDAHPEAVQARLAFASGLQTDRSPGAAVLARATVRGLLRDVGNGVGDPAALRQLMEYTQDGALKADMPVLPDNALQPFRMRREPLEICVEAGDTGALSLLDAAFLPGGQCVVALGEAGIRLLSRDGRTVVHWQQPADSLVMSDQGDRALALARRGEARRLARLDFIARRAVPWCDALLSSVAPNYDGSIWYVATGDDFAAVDATASDFLSLWRRPGLGPVVYTIARDGERCSLLTHQVEKEDAWGNPIQPNPQDGEACVVLPQKWERWTYELPRDLRRQLPIPAPESAPGKTFPVRRAVSSEGCFADLTLIVTRTGDTAMEAEQRTQPQAKSVNGESSDLQGDLTWTLTVDGWSWRTTTIICMRNVDAMALTLRASTCRLLFGGHWLACAIPTETGIDCYLYERSTSSCKARISLAGANVATLRFTANELTVADNRGRLLVLDLAQGRLLRNLRV